MVGLVIFIVAWICIIYEFINAPEIDYKGNIKKENKQ